MTARRAPAPPPTAPARRRLTLAEIEGKRSTPGASALLFITDRCPVECEHCSVASLRTSPSIRDYDDFGALLGQLTVVEGLEMIGISGGEPFAERRGLEMAFGVLAPGHDLVVYTSGYWAKGRSAPSWVGRILARSASVFLSPDAFHARRLGDDVQVRAVQAVLDSGAPLVLQLVDEPGARDRAGILLQQAGATDACDVEVNLVPRLAYGRSAALLIDKPRLAAERLPRCGATASPVVRYDRTMTACCNEGVIMGGGPARLRRQVDGRVDAVGEAMRGFQSDSWIAAMASVGPAGIAEHPRFRTAGQASFRDTCDFCWRMQQDADEDVLSHDRLLAILAHVGGMDDVR